MPLLDIIIVNWNAGKLLRDCLDSVYASALGQTVLGRVVVVDNHSTDGSVDGFTEAYPTLTLIRLPTNRGFGAACNLGAAQSTADYLLFLNPDVVLDRDTLDGAVTFMEEGPNAEVDVSTVRLRDIDGNTQRCCARFPTPGRMVAQTVGLDRLLPRFFPPHFLREWDHEDTRPVPQVMGAFLLIRRTAFNRLEGFDERFFVYYEDVDLCRRISLKGGLCVHNASVSAVHWGGGTTARIKARRQFYGAHSKVIYARKYFGWRAAAMLTFAGMLLDPLARIGRGAAHGSIIEMADAIRGTVMFWANLPNLIFSTGRPGHRPADTPQIRADQSRRPLSVLALTRYPRLGASSRTRFLSYLPALQMNDVNVTVSPFFDDAYLPALYAGRRPSRAAIAQYYARRLKALLHAGEYDLVWVEKEALPWIPFAVEAFLLRGTPFVVDFDDAWFLRYGSHHHPVVRRLLGGKFERLVKRANLAVVGNDFLTNWARSTGRVEVVQLPTPVNLDVYKPVRHDGWNGPLRIGWMGTPTSAAAYLRPLLPVLAEAVQGGWATLTVVGAGGIDFSSVGATVYPWSEAQEVERLHSFDVGIMPLVDDVWALGKCAYKLIQYMAVGLPVVASPVGMNCQVVRPGVNGFLATSLDEWRTALLTLAQDAELRRRMGEAGRKLVEREYSLSVVEPRLVKALRRAAE